MQAEDAFVEYAEIFGDLYGTSFAALKQCLESGKDVILELDWQGALQIKEKLPSAIGIFLLPPSRDELLRRLTRRGRDPKESIEKRLSGAQVDIAHYRDFDYLVVNKDFAETRVNLAHIIQAERLRTRRQQTKLSDWLKTMLA